MFQILTDIYSYYFNDIIVERFLSLLLKAIKVFIIEVKQYLRMSFLRNYQHKRKKMNFLNFDTLPRFYRVGSRMVSGLKIHNQNG